MGYDLNRHQLLLDTQPRRIFFKRQTIARFTYPLSVFASVLFGVFVVLSIVAPAFAASQSPSVPPCTTHLSSMTHFSANATYQEKEQRLTDQRSVGQKTMPLHLGFLLGVRHALMPHAPNKDVNDRHSIQPLNAQTGGSSHALAIAAYRACQKDVALQKISEAQ